MCSFGNQGDSMFVTYRDPNLTETYDVYEHAAQFVEEFDADERDMKKYIIGTISSMDMPMGPDDMGARSFNAYLMGKTEEELQKDRDQVPWVYKRKDQSACSSGKSRCGCGQSLLYRKRRKDPPC